MQTNCRSPNTRLARRRKRPITARRDHRDNRRGGSESALHRFVVAGAAIKALCDRKAPAFHHRTEPRKGQEPFHGIATGLAAFAQCSKPGCDVLYLPKHGADTGGGRWKTFQKRVPRRREALGQYERLADWAAAHFINYSRRYPIDVIKHTQAGKDAIFGVNGVVRNAGLVRRSLDDEAACLIGRRRATDVMVVLD